jgi:hypothetical protein
MFRIVLSYGALAFLGLFIGATGTVGHRYTPPWGSILVLVVVLSAATFSRAWRSWIGLAVFAQAWVATVLFLDLYTPPSGSVLIVDDALGKIWLFGGVVAAVIPACIPRRWITEAPIAGR